MISCVTYKNLNSEWLSKAFMSQFDLRYKCFIKRLNYNVSCFQGMEYDQYDTPAATYLVYQSPEGRAWGCSRLTPVMQGSMLQDIWPDVVDHPEKIFVDGVWEGTRFCIDKELPPDLRRQICKELVLAYLEFGLATGIKRITGVMPPLIYKKVFGDAGCEYDFLGPKKKIDERTIIQAASMSVSARLLARVRQRTGIHSPVTDVALSALIPQKQVA